MNVKNFLSFSEAVFDFENQGLVLVEGDNRDDESAKSNGSGKSAMIDALVWCLFGTTLRGYENDEVVNRKVGEDCLVSVVIEVNETFVIQRARKHSKLKNSLRVTDADGDISGPSNAETQEVVEKLIGCTLHTFLSSVVFGQDSAYRFSSLTDKAQKEILDEVLGVERFSAACDAARAQAAVVGARLAVVNRDLEKANEAHDVAESEEADLQEKNERYAAEHVEKFAEEKRKLKVAKDWIKKNAKSEDLDKLKTAFDKIVKNVTTLESAVDICRLASREAVAMHTSAKMKVDELRAHVKRHDALTGDCPTCGQNIDDMQRDRVVGDFKKKLKPAEAALAKVNVAVAEIEQQLADAERKVKDERKAATIAQVAINEHNIEAANLVSWKRRVADHEQRIAELADETNPYSALVKKAAARRAKHEAEVNILAKEVEAQEAVLKLADFWVKAFGARGLRSLLLDSSLPLLNEEAGRISRAVTGGAISIEFSAESELKSGKTIDRFEVRVDNKHGAASYLGNSAGEKAKVDLCVGLALQRLVASRSSASFNVCFFDEVFDHLDAAAHERVVEVLSEVDKESVFVVSHNEDLRAWFPNTLTIVKRKGFSTVEP